MTKVFRAALLMILVTVCGSAKAGLLSTTTGIITGTTSTLLSGTTTTTTDSTTTTDPTTTSTTTTSTDIAYTPPPGLLTDEFIDSVTVSTDSTLVVSAGSTVYQVPEPGTLTLLCIGLIALVANKKQRKGR